MRNNYASGTRNGMFFFLLALSFMYQKAISQTVTYSQSFVANATYNPGSSQYDGWTTFCAQLTPRTYTSVTIKGSRDAVGVTTTDSTVATALASALNTSSSYNNGTWAVGQCGGGMEFTNIGSICSCANGYTLRPKIGNANWGGVSGATCGATSQTLTVVFTYAAAPTITSFTPTSAATGSTVTLTGTNFTTATAVSFGGVAATSFTVVNDTTITAVVGSGASGSVSVTTPGGTATRTGFTYIPTPSIASFTPTRTCAGTNTITISGNNFSGVTQVAIGGTNVSSFTVNSNTSITAVTNSLTGGLITLTSPGGTVNSTSALTISSPANAPVITSIGSTALCTISGGSVDLSAQPLAGKALTFNGTNQNVSLGNWFTQQNFTVELWVKPGASQVDYACIIDDNHLTGSGWVIQQNANVLNQYYFYVSGVYSGNFSLTANTWQHLAVVKSSTQLLVYVNGTLVNTTSLPANFNITYSNQFLNLGRHQTYGRYFNGSEDEVRLWSTVRTQAQIQASMNNTVSGFSAGLVGYYRLDEGSGTTTTDLSGNGRNGTVVNSPTWQTSAAPVAYNEGRLWSPNNESSQAITVSAPGAYFVKALDDNGCWTTSNTINVTALPNYTITPSSGANGSLFPSTPYTVCSGYTTFFSITPNTGYHVVDVFVNGISQGAITNYAFLNVTANQTISATFAPDCVVPTLSTSQTNISCLNPTGSATVITTGGSSPFTYLWSNGQTTATATGLTAGTHNVTVTATGGCTVATSVTISGNTTPPSTPGITPSGATLTCTTTSINATASSTGQGTVSYLWNGGTTPNTAANAFGSAGTYTVTATDSANNCTASNSITIGSNTTPPTAVVTPSSGTITCTNTSINLVASGGVGYLWDNTTTNAARTITATGTYTVTVTGANGCTAQASAIIGSDTTPPTVNASASPASICAGTSAALSATGNANTYVWTPGNLSGANPTVSPGVTTTYTVTGTSTGNGCTATAQATVNVTAQPLWYLDADNDHYYTGAAVPSCTAPGSGYTTTGLIAGGDCNDASAAIHPAATEICYNNIDDNCNNSLSEGCTPVVVNMTPSYHNSTLPSLATAVPAVEYSYPGTTDVKYRFSITNVTTGVTAPDIIQTSRYVILPGAIRNYNVSYSIKVSAVINGEVVPFYGNTITVFAPVVQPITLNTGTCGATLASLSSTLTANAGLNATGYTFRIRLNDANPNPTYGYSQSATRFISANTFSGFPLQYSGSYKVAVQYTFTDPATNLPVDSGYGAECTVNTPAIPVIAMAAPACGSTAASITTNMSATSASYATGYQFRIRLFADNGPNPVYYYTTVNASRFSNLSAFQNVTLQYNTEYALSVQYSITNGSGTSWSGYGPDCKLTTPFFPTTSLIPSQCGLSAATPLNQQLNISPYPGFPHYKVLLEELVEGEETPLYVGEKEITYSYFKLSDIPGAQLGKNYNVSVAIKLNGVFGPYSSACDLHTPTPTKNEMAVPFTATAYPNPFANSFKLDLKTSSPSGITVKVYDMVGRLMEQREIKGSDTESIGNNYPTGIYNVVVAQDDTIQTLRVVKR